MTKPNEERSLVKFETNMDKHRQKIFMQLNGFKLNAEGEYEYDEALKIPVEDLRNPEHENYDAIFAAACDKVDALREATQSGALNLDESTASVWHYIARANNWTNEGGYAYDDDLGLGEYKVFGGGGKFDTNSASTYTGVGGMSIDPHSPMKTITGVDYDWTEHQSDPRKNVAVLVPGEPDWQSLPPEEKGGKGDLPLTVQMSGKDVTISGPSLLMVPPVNCAEGEVYCGGRCAVIQGGVVSSMVNCICLGACDPYGDVGDCNGFEYGNNECCDDAKYCKDGTISCGGAQCSNGSADRIALPYEAQLAYDFSQTATHDKYGIPSLFCKPVLPEQQDSYPTPDWLAKAIGGYEELAAKDANFYVKFLDGLFNARWSDHCLSPIAPTADSHIVNYSDNEEETYIHVGIEELHPMWTDGGLVDHNKFVEYTKSWRLGTVTGMDHPHFRHINYWTLNDQPCSTQNCGHEKRILNPNRYPEPGRPIEYDRWVISIWTTSEETGYQKITAQQYKAEDEGHILWKIPSYGFVKYMISFPWMATYDQATIHTRCGEDSSLITGVNLG